MIVKKSNENKLITIVVIASLVTGPFKDKIDDEQT